MQYFSIDKLVFTPVGQCTTAVRCSASYQSSLSGFTFVSRKYRYDVQRRSCFDVSRSILTQSLVLLVVLCHWLWRVSTVTPLERSPLEYALRTLVDSECSSCKHCRHCTPKCILLCCATSQLIVQISRFCTIIGRWFMCFDAVEVTWSLLLRLRRDLSRVP